MLYHQFQILFSVLFIAFVTLVLAAGFHIIKRCGNPLPKLFYEFDKKIWMTLGLGIIFFGFYFTLISSLSWMLGNQTLRWILSFIYTHKVISIYLGLLIFALFTLSIYLARMLIKYLYKKKSRHD